MTTNNMLDTGNVPLGFYATPGATSAGGTGNNASAYVAAYDLILSELTSPIVDLAQFSTGVSGQLLVDGTGFSNPIWGVYTYGNTTFPTGRLLSFQILTSGTGATYTPTSAQVNTLIVEMVGGGGGAGGCTGSATTYAASAGGCSGSYALAIGTGFLGSVTATYTVGTGGSGSTGTGAAGGSTSFSGLANGTTKGGTGGGSRISGSTTATGTFLSPVAPSTSPAVTGTLFAYGASGQNGFYSSATCVGGAGGSSVYGGGAIGPTLTSAGTSAGNNAGGYGSGGSGCCSYLDTTSTNQIGGNGSDGLIIVWEYS